MLNIYIFLLLIIFKADARSSDTDPVEITFEIQSKILGNGPAFICDHKGIDKVQHTYTVREGEEFKIITKYNAFINHFICHNYNDNSDVYLYAEKDRLKNVTTFKAEKRMGGQWNCTILAHRNNQIHPFIQYKQSTYSAASCFMTVHVRQTAPAQTILVNNMVLQVHRTDLSEKNIDFTAEYQYADGDVVNVTCINFLNQAPLTMEYMMAGTKSDKSTMEGLSSNETIGFHAKLHSGHNNSYMICTRTEPTDYSKVMVRFVLQEEFNIIHVSINGMTLRPKLNNVENNYYEIEYMYDPYQVINVVCEVRRTDLIMVLPDKGSVDKVSSYRKTVLIPRKKMEMSFYLKSTDEKKLWCGSDYADGRSAELVAIRFTAGKFSYDQYRMQMELTSNHGPVIELYADKKLKVIYYEFNDGETLKFRCGPLRLRIPGPVLYLHLKDSDKCWENDCAIYKTLHVTSKHENTEIVCYLKEKTYDYAEDDIVLREIRVILREKVPTSTSPTISSTSTNTTTISPTSNNTSTTTITTTTTTTSPTSTTISPTTTTTFTTTTNSPTTTTTSGTITTTTTSTTTISPITNTTSTTTTSTTTTTTITTTTTTTTTDTAADLASSESSSARQIDGARASS